MIDNLKKIILLLSSLLVLELVLQLASLWVPAIKDAAGLNVQKVGRWSSHPQWGRIGNPAYWEHDEWGFRNPHRPENADIVTIGDSFTYGTSVASNENWPSQVALLTDSNVYNMGVGATNPIDYMNRFDVALNFKPEYVIVALWMGNDFVLREGGIDQLSQEYPELLQDADYMLASQVQFENSWSAEYDHFKDNCGVEKSAVNTIKKPAVQEGSIRRWLSSSVILYGVAREIKNLLVNYTHEVPEILDARGKFENDRNSLSESQKKHCFAWDGAETKTIFFNSWRSLALNVDDPRVRAGVDATKGILRAMHSHASEQQVTLLVAMIPTKESLYADAFSQQGQNAAVAAQLNAIHKHERSLSLEFKKLAQDDIFAILDLHDVLLHADKQVFFSTRDAHLNANGHKVVAEEIARWLINNQSH